MARSPERIEKEIEGGWLGTGISLGIAVLLLLGCTAFAIYCGTLPPERFTISDSAYDTEYRVETGAGSFWERVCMADIPRSEHNGEILRALTPGQRKGLALRLIAIGAIWKVAFAMVLLFLNDLYLQVVKWGRPLSHPRVVRDLRWAGYTLFLFAVLRYQGVSLFSIFGLQMRTVRDIMPFLVAALASLPLMSLADMLRKYGHRPADTAAAHRITPIYPRR